MTEQDDSTDAELQRLIAESRERPCATPGAEDLVETLYRLEALTMGRVLASPHESKQWNSFGVLAQVMRECVEQGRLEALGPLAITAENSVRKKVRPLPSQLLDSQVRDSALSYVDDWLAKGGDVAKIPHVISEVTYRLERLAPDRERYHELLHCWIPGCSKRENARQAIGDCQTTRAGKRWNEPADYVRNVLRALGVKNANNAFKHVKMRGSNK